MNLRRVSRIVIVIAGGKSTAVAAAATLASALWLGASVPSLSPLGSTSGSSQQLIAISLQSALLGIDDAVARQPTANILAASRALGLPDNLGGLTPERLRSLVASGGLRTAVSSPLVLGLHPGVQATRESATPTQTTLEPVSLDPQQPRHRGTPGVDRPTVAQSASAPDQQASPTPQG